MSKEYGGGSETLKSGVFFGKSIGTSKGYGERETSLTSLERGGHSFRARFAHLSKVVFFLARVFAPVRGMEKGKLLSLRSREGRHFFRARFARLSKVVVFGCKISGTSKGYGEREISLATLKSERGTFSGLALLASQKWWFLVAKQWHQ